MEAVTEQTVPTAPAQGAQRLVFIDLLNIAACFGVVALHCASTVFRFEDSPIWMFGMAVQAVFHWPVPVFFMIMGVTLLNYREKYSTAQFMKKRFFRTVIPFFIWSALMLLYKMDNGSLKVTGPRQFFNLFFNNEILGIYWFFFSMFGLYLAMPYLSLLAKEKYKRLMWYFIGLFVVIQGVLPLLRTVGLRFADLSIPGVAGYAAYVFLGWLLYHTTLRRRTRILVYAAGAAAAVVMFFGTYYVNLRENDPSLNTLFMDYRGLCTFTLSLAVFVFFRHISWQPTGILLKIIRLLAGASFGVYLVQMFVLYELADRFAVSDHSIRYMVFGSIGVYLFCALLVILVKKIPLVGKIFP